MPKLKAPGTVQASSGALYIPDSNGYVYPTSTADTNDLIRAGCSAVAASPIALATRKTVCGSSNLPALTTGNGPSQNDTYTTVFSSWGEYNAVQLYFLNNSASAVTIDNATVSAGATIYPNGINDLSNSSGAWQAPTGAIAVPAGSTKQFGIGLSPIIPLQSIPRAQGELDGGKYPLLFVRTYIASGNTTAPYIAIPTTYVAAWNTIYNENNNLGLSLQCGVTYGGNGVTTIGNVGSPLACTSGTPLTSIVAGAIFYYDQPRTTICAVGDSTDAGNADGDTTILSSTIQATSILANAGKQVSFLNAAVSGATMPNIVANALNVISTFSPDILVLHPWTVNSAFTTQAQWDTQWNQCMTIVNAQLAAGKQILLHTPWPNNSVTISEYPYQQVIHQRCLNLASNTTGVQVLDMNQFMNSTGGWLYPQMTADGTHETPLGYSLIGAAEAQVMAVMVQ